MSLLINTSLLFAQSYTIQGKVADSLSLHPIEYASVGLLRLDSTAVAAINTGMDGRFTLKYRAAGKYILKVSFMGYVPHFQNIELKSSHKNQELNDILLSTNDHLLGEAIVKTVLAKVEQKEDTTVFNAGAYRVPVGSTLEALIKQLPGIEVAEDGSITWKGKKINELLVNGKDFFKGDKDVAMKNLPSDLVSKIKAYDKKSDYTEQTGIDDGEEKAVLDISTKAKLDHSWISNVDLAYGTKDRYSADLFASRFTDRSRVSAYVSIGNVDRYHYGNGGGGLSSNKSGGLDFSWTNDKQKREAGRFEIGGSAYYGYTGTDMISTSSSETFLSSGSGSSFSNSMNRNSYSSAYIGTNFRMEWNPDSMTSIKFRPSFSHNYGDNEGESRTATFNADPYAIPDMVSPLDSLFAPHIHPALAQIAVNRNAHRSLGDNESNSLTLDLNLLRRLNSKGRNVSLQAKGGFRKSESNAFSLSDIYYFNGQDGRFLNQYSTTPSKNWDYNIRMGYAEPISKEWVAELRYSYGYKFTDTDRSRYNLDQLGGQWGNPSEVPFLGSLPTTADSLAAVRDLQNSQYATYKYFDHIFDLTMQYKTEKLRVNVGVKLNPEKTKMEYNRPGQHIDTLITRDVFQVLPDARFTYRFNKMKSLEFRYRGWASQPSMTHLLAVVDNSNPLSISMGNPGLKPSWTNSLSFNYSGYDPERQGGIYAGADYSQTGRSVSNLLVYDESTGVRYTRPQNINGNWNANSYVMYNTGLGKEKKFTISTSTYFQYNNRVGYVSSFASADAGSPSQFLSQGGETDRYDEVFDRADIQKNITRSLGINERLRMGYRTDLFDIGLSGSLSYDHSSSELQERSNMNTWRYDYGGNANFNFDFGLSISTDIRMSSRRGYSDASMNTNELLWNAQISQSFLKERAATISLKFHDILHRQSNVSRRVDAMQRSDSWTNAINSYAMLHFVYKLNIFPGKKKAGGKTIAKADAKNDLKSDSKGSTKGDHPAIKKAKKASAR